MAQHISLFKNEFHKEITDSILNRFSKKNIGLASLKYEEVKDSQYKLCAADRVFINKRKIKGNQEVFEIHFDTNNKKIIDIFWVK